MIYLKGFLHGQKCVLVRTLGGPMVFFTDTTLDDTFLHILQFHQWIFILVIWFLFVGYKLNIETCTNLNNVPCLPITRFLPAQIHIAVAGLGPGLSSLGAPNFPVSGSSWILK